MANTRTFAVERLTYGATSIGGLQSFGFAPTFAVALQSTGDGAVGVEDFDVAGLGAAVNLVSTDIDHAPALMAYEGGAVIVGARLSGDSGNKRTQTLAGIVGNSFGLSVPRDADATLSYGARVRFATGAEVLAALKTAYVPADAVAGAPYDAIVKAQEFPTRLFRPNTAVFTPEGGSALPVPHFQSLNLNASRQVLEDSSDTDVGQTAVDGVDWSGIGVSLTFMASTIGTASIEAMDLIDAIQGILTVDLTGRSGGAADAKTLTVRGLKFQAYTEAQSRGYTIYTVTGVAVFKAAVAGTEYTWDGGAEGIIQIA